MVFKISNQRKKRLDLNVVSKGLVLRPNLGIELQYQTSLSQFNKKLLSLIEQEIHHGLSAYQVGRTFDHPFKGFLDTIFKKVKALTTTYLEDTAKQLVFAFINQSQDYADSSVATSLKTLGLVQPRLDYNRSIQQAKTLTEDANLTLITNISDDTQTFLYERIMRSLTSDDPQEQGQYGIAQALQEAGIKNQSRIRFIAKDQTSKLYSALSNARLDQNGVEEFEWLHSGAGKHPRPLHLSYNGNIYRRDDPRFEQAPLADRGLPGFAFNCRCTMLPVIKV